MREYLHYFDKKISFNLSHENEENDAKSMKRFSHTRDIYFYNVLNDIIITI